MHCVSHRFFAWYYFKAKKPETYIKATRRLNKMLYCNTKTSPLRLMIAGFNVYNSQKSDVMSELALANVEALAESELSQKCGDCSTDKQVYCCTLVIEGLGTFTLNKD